MKLLAVSVFTVMLISTLASGNELKNIHSLQDDFNEFVDLLPFEEILQVAARYLLTDKDFQQSMQYLLGVEFASVWDQIFALKEVRDVLDYLERAGVEAYAFFNDLADLLGLNHIKPEMRVSLPVGSRSLSGFIDEVRTLLPKEKLLELFEHKMETSAEFKEFFENVQSLDFQRLLAAANNSAELQSLFQKLKENGIDVDKLFDLLKGVFGWHM